MATARREASDAFHERAAELRALAPATDADGKPTGFAAHIDAVVAVADAAFARDDHALIEFCLFLVLLLGKPDPPDTQPPTVNAFLANSIFVVHGLREQGQVDRAHALSEAGLVLGRYWIASGLMEQAAKEGDG